MKSMSSKFSWVTAADMGARKSSQNSPSAVAAELVVLAYELTRSPTSLRHQATVVPEGVGHVAISPSPSPLLAEPVTYLKA